MWLNRIFVIYTKCYIISDVPWCAKMGPIQLAIFGLTSVRLRHKVACLHGSGITDHIFLTMLTHNSHTCDTSVTRKWSIVQSERLSVMHCLSAEPAYVKNTVIRRRCSFKNRDKWRCIAIVILMFTGPLIPKIDNCHNANFLIAVGNTSCRHNDNLQHPRWWQRWRHDDSRFSVQWHTKHLINVLWLPGTIYNNLLSDIFHHSEPFVKCDMNQHFTLVTNLS